jgi:hypothetical protein
MDICILVRSNKNSRVIYFHQQSNVDLTKTFAELIAEAVAVYRKQLAPIAADPVDVSLDMGKTWRIQ